MAIISTYMSIIVIIADAQPDSDSLRDILYEHGGEIVIVMVVGWIAWRVFPGRFLGSIVRIRAGIKINVEVRCKNWRTKEKEYDEGSVHAPDYSPKTAKKKAKCEKKVRRVHQKHLTLNVQNRQRGNND